VARRISERQPLQPIRSRFVCHQPDRAAPNGGTWEFQPTGDEYARYDLFGSSSPRGRARTASPVGNPCIGTMSIEGTLGAQMDEAGLKSIAMLLQARNDIDARITDIVGRPVVHGHLSDWIAAQIFDIELEPVANRVVDGWFRSGPLAGCSVNVKHYTRNEGLLDMTESEELDYYLVMTGPRSAPARAARAHRPWTIDHVHLFDARDLADALRTYMRRIGVATSVRAEYWQAAEIYPVPAKPLLRLTADQTAALDGFRSA
jgi:hypothetical protein